MAKASAEFSLDSLCMGAWFNLDRDGLRAKRGVSRCEDDLSRSRRSGLDPNGAGSSTLRKRKGIVADEDARASELQGDITAGEEPGRAEFVDDLKDEPGCVDSIADDVEVVGRQYKLVFPAVSGEGS